MAKRWLTKRQLEKAQKDVERRTDIGLRVADIIKGKKVLFRGKSCEIVEVIEPKLGTDGGGLDLFCTDGNGYRTNIRWVEPKKE